MNVLFVCAWWPSRVHPTHGNFVQKHARVVARRHSLTVLAVQEDPTMAAGRLKCEIGEEFGYRVVQVYYGRAAATPQWLNLYNRAHAYVAGAREAKRLNGRPDIVHGHVVVDGGIVAALLGRSYGVPHIITAHSIIYREPKALSLTRRLLAKWATRRAAAVLPVSDQLGRDMQRVNGLSGNYITVPNVVDEQLFKLSEGWEEGEVFKLLHVSNFDRWQKNPEGLLRAFAALNAEQPGCFSLRIAGDGDPNFLRALIEKSGLSMEVVTLTGPHSEREVADLMQQHHALVLFSNYETQGVVLLEALISGLPCVAARVGGVPSVIREGENGFMVKPGDEAELVRALKRIVKKYNTFNHHRMRREAIDKYGEQAIGRRLDDLYDRARK